MKDSPAHGRWLEDRTHGHLTAARLTNPDNLLTRCISAAFAKRLRNLAQNKLTVVEGSAAYTLVSSADLNARGNSDICTSLDDTTLAL